MSGSSRAEPRGRGASPHGHSRPRTQDRPPQLRGPQGQDGGAGYAHAGDSPGAAQHCRRAGTLTAVLPHTQTHTRAHTNTHLCVHLCAHVISADAEGDLGSSWVGEWCSELRGVAHASSSKCFLVRDLRVPPRGLCRSPQPRGSTLGCGLCPSSCGQLGSQIGLG